MSDTPNGRKQPGTWRLMDAKTHFSEVVERAGNGQPQIVTKRGRAAAVILSPSQYRALQGKPRTLADLFGTAPSHEDDGLDFEAQRLPGPDRDTPDF